MPDSQLYYWSQEWQSLEAESLAELSRGEAKRFTSAADAIAWLLSDDGE